VIAGKIISANMRKMDVAARYGGDEFILLIPHAAGVDAARVVDRIRAEFAIASAGILARAQGVTMSIGIASAITTNPTRPEQLLAAADAALYKSKAAGRNRITIAEAEIASADADVAATT
jgi:diguanylate cyclase (GGDEF)-like protein